MLPDFESPINFLAGRGDVPEHLRRLIALEVAEFAAVLGQQLVLDGNQAGSSTDAWHVRVDPSTNHARLEADLLNRILLMTVPDRLRVGEGLNLLHSLAHDTALLVEDAEVVTYAAAFDRMYSELENIYPYFQLRGLDWGAITDRYGYVRELEGQEFWAGASLWVAELGDAHTRLSSPHRGYTPPYQARMGPTAATLLTVPTDSAAWLAGARPGDQLVVDDGIHWLNAVGASPHHHALVAGRRFLMMTTDKRDFACVTQKGQRITWREHIRSRSSLSADGSCITIHQFAPDVPGKLRQVIASLKGRVDSLTLDLRGNTGGSLVAAADARRLFVSHDGPFGSVQFSNGNGSLADPVQLEETRAKNAWQGSMTILVDSMTYSAAEDFLHPLVGLPTVRIQGGPTGGGSGRPHTRALMDGIRLSVSTAITYTRDGRPIELHGIR